MKEIKLKLHNIYKIYNQLVSDDILVMQEKQVIESYQNYNLNQYINIDKVYDDVNKLVDKDILKRTIIDEIIRKMIVKESTLSTSTIEGEIVDSETLEKAELNINSLESDERKKYSSILSLLDILDRYVFPTEINSDEIKYLHKRIFNNKKMNPGNFKASNNFTWIDEETKLVYIDTTMVDIELIKLWEFINDKSTDEHPIIKASLIHMYLGSIHPFADGNGRIIRILFNKYLSKQFDRPVFLDSLIYKNIDLYKKVLNEFRKDDINSKTKFIDFVNLIMRDYLEDLKNKISENINEFFRVYKLLLEDDSIPKTKTYDLSLFIIKHHSFDLGIMINELSITRLTAIKYSKKIVSLKLFNETTHGKKNIYIKIK